MAGFADLVAKLEKEFHESNLTKIVQGVGHMSKGLAILGNDSSRSTYVDLDPISKG